MEPPLPFPAGVARDHPFPFRGLRFPGSWAVWACLLLTLASLVGCAHTPIRRTSIAPEVFELAARSSHPLQVRVTHTLAGTQGYQYLLVLFPLGRVTVEDPSGEVFSVLYPMLATRGIRPVHPEDCANCPLLTLNLSDLSLSAFDFLVTRRVRAHVRLEAVLRSGSGTLLWESEVEESAGNLRQYGFAPQLRSALDQALAQALEPVAHAVALRYNRAQSK